MQSQPTKRRLIVIAIPIALVVLTISVWWAFQPRYLTVVEVWQNAEALNGQLIRVRGWADIEIWVTAVGCKPARCDCNESRGYPFIYGDVVEPPRNQPVAFDEKKIYLSGALCSGDECFLSCPVFNPNSAPVFEFVGILNVQYYEGKISRLDLEKIDFEASRRLFGGKWLWLMIPDTISTLPSEIRLRSPGIG